MVELKIKREFLPNRCEICHKTDSFNPETNECSRCKSLIEKLSLNPTDIGIAMRQYSNDFSYKLAGIVGGIIGVILISLSLVFEMMWEFFLSFGIAILVICLAIPLYYRKRCKRLVWLIENIQPTNMEITIRKATDSFGSNLYYIELNSGKLNPIPIPVYSPPWDTSSYIDNPIQAQVYCDPKGGAIIRTNKGLLMSLSTMPIKRNL